MRRPFARRLGQVACPLGAEAGVSLIEVLVAAFILTLVLVPMLDFSAYMFNGQAYGHQLAATLAAAKMEELANVAYRTSGNTNSSVNTNWGPMGEDDISVGSYVFNRRWTRASAPAGKEQAWLRRYTVKVTCTNCRQPVEVEVVSYLAKVGPGSTSS